MQQPISSLRVFVRGPLPTPSSVGVRRALLRRRLLAIPALLALLLASAPWTARLSIVRAASAPSIGGLRVVGNQIVNANNQPLVLHGVDRSGTEYACIQGWGLFDGPNDAASVQAIAAWHVNAVRVPLNEDCWLGINGAAPSYSGSAYQQAIVNYVTLLNQNGLVAILDLHWNAPGTAQAVGQQQMADADHAPAFWSSVATAFKGNSSVIFDLYNEPHDLSWSCWRDGGWCPGVSYQVAGMQSLVNAVRATGATNILMLGGLAWSNDLSQWQAYKPSDPLGNLVAAWHVYNFNACSTVSCYDSTVAPVVQHTPLVAGEIGENDCAHGFVDTLMSWLDAHNAGYVGWSWNTANCANGPALITNYSGAPTAFGQGLQNHLAALSQAPSATATPVPSTATATATPGSASPSATATAGPATSTATAISNAPSPTATATSTPRPTATNTATAAPAPATATPSANGGIVSAAGSVAAGSGPYYGQENITLSNSVPLTALSITVTVQKTPGVSYAGQYTTFWAGMVMSAHSDTGSQLVYVYTLTPGQVVPVGNNWLVGSQFGGNGAAHPYTGDTFTVTATGNGRTTTLSGLMR